MVCVLIIIIIIMMWLDPERLHLVPQLKAHGMLVLLAQLMLVMHCYPQ